MKKVSKRINQIRHAKRRAMERYGLILNVSAAVEQIQTGKAEFLERQTNRITLWKIKQQDQELRVVYDKLRKTIVTCLPLDEPQEEKAA